MHAIRHFYIYSVLCARISEKLRNKNGNGKDKDKDNFLCSNKHTHSHSFKTYFMLCSPGRLASHATLMVPPMWSLNMTNTNLIGLNSFSNGPYSVTNVTNLDTFYQSDWNWFFFTNMSNLTFTNVSKVGLSENFYRYVCAPTLHSTLKSRNINKRDKKIVGESF